MIAKGIVLTNGQYHHIVSELLSIFETKPPR